MAGFKRPRNGHYTRYCGQCRRWTPSDDERLRGYGLCEYTEVPDHAVSVGYWLSSVATDQYRGACPLFESKARNT